LQQLQALVLVLAKVVVVMAIKSTYGVMMQPITQLSMAYVMQH
jgi:hypothetical protein